ncbi:unnamed protein product, partial [Symbiodinium sp. CCMP2592]
MCDDGFRKTKERTAVSDYSFCGDAAKHATVYVPPAAVRSLVDLHFDAAMEAVVSQPLQWSLCSCQPDALCTGAPLRFYKHLGVPVVGKSPWCFLWSLRRQGFEALDE